MGKIIGFVECEGQRWKLADFTVNETTESAASLGTRAERLLRGVACCVHRLEFEHAELRFIGGQRAAFRVVWDFDPEDPDADEIATIHLPREAIGLREDARSDDPKPWWPKWLVPKVEIVIRHQHRKAVEAHEGDPDWLMGVLKTSDGRSAVWAWFEADGLQDACLDVEDTGNWPEDFDAQLRELYASLLLGEGPGQVLAG